MDETLYQTERLRVRSWTHSESDVRATFRLYGDPEVCRYIGGEALRDLEEAREYLARRFERHAIWSGRFGVWAVEDLVSGEAIGSVLMKPIPDANHELTEDIEIGWHLVQAEWGKGYGKEMGRGLVEYAEGRSDLDRLHVLVEPPQLRSIAIALKLGFAHQGTTRKYYEGIELEHYLRELRR